MSYDQIAIICDNAKTTLENILPNYDIKIITEEFLRTYQTKNIPEKLLETDRKDVSNSINNK